MDLVLTTRELDRLVRADRIKAEALEEEACDKFFGEGSGAVALFPILDFASDIYHKMSTFVQADIVEYQPLD